MKTLSYLFGRTKKLSKLVSKFYYAHFSGKDLNITKDNVLSYESTGEKLKTIFKEYEKLSGKEGLSMILDKEYEDCDDPQE